MGIAHLLLSLLFGLMLLWLMALPVVARMRLQPPRMTDGKALYRLKRVTPADVELPYENVLFELPDAQEKSLRLKGWWIPAASSSQRTILILHGYADAKVGALAWAPFLHEAGYNLLLYDARAHGESDGRYCTAGYYERHNLLDVMRQLRLEHPHETQRLAILGISMGGVTALAAAALGGAMAADCLIVDSVFSDYGSAGVLHASLFGLPGRSILQPATWLAQRLSGARFSEVAPLLTAAQQRQPTLLIQPEDDRVIAPLAAARLRERLMQSPAAADCRVLTIPGASHVTGLQAAPELYRKSVLEFLAARMSAGDDGGVNA